MTRRQQKQYVKICPTIFDTCKYFKSKSCLSEAKKANIFLIEIDMCIMEYVYEYVRYLCIHWYRIYL